jgi:glycosyltransferase involved in cell wall biosynthesis
MRLVFVTQTLDAEHPALAQTLDLVGALARRFDELVVLCQSVGPHPALPANVRVQVFGARTRAGRGIRFARTLARELRARPDALLAHMVPLYVVLAAPLAKPLRVPIALWYTHWHAGRLLRLAERLATVVLSVDERSFPIASRKVRGIGHAIDVDRFSPGAVSEAGGRVRLLALGRTARWKGYETMLAGLERAVERGVDAELEIRGPQLTGDERAHVEELRRTVAGSPELEERVRIEPPLPRDDLPQLLRGVDALLSATQPRGGETLDKVVFEAAASGVPVLASNSALDVLLGELRLELRFRPGDAESLAQVLVAFATAPASLRAEIGVELRRRVVASHSVDSWADAVARIVTAERRK